jgi:predicted nucleotidyltransferase
MRFAEPIKIHDKLNPKLWTKDRLDPKVRNGLLRIAKEFYKFLEVKAPIEDILITGSQANYNYTDFSDIDLHLVFDFSKISCDEPIEQLFDTKRKLWNEKHDIDIYDIPVEVYAEDYNKPAISSRYSLVTDKWIDHPDKPSIEYNKEKVQRLTSLWTMLIDHAVKSQNLNACQHIKDLLGKYRKIGLKKQGEYGPSNLAFKSLRNSGKIKQLIDTINWLKDEDLSID